MLVPKLRFKEFTDEWASDNIGNFCNILMCKRIFADQTSLNEEIPFYKIGTIGSKPDTFISRNLFEEYKKKYNYPRYGELLITCSGTVGKCTIFDGKDSYYQDSNIVWIDNPTLKISNSFLYYLVSKVDWSKLNSTTIVRIYNDNLRKLNLKYPANKNEQEKITKVMMLIDKKIELQSKKIEVLKLYKKGTLNTLTNNVDNNNLKTLKEIGTDYSGLSGKSKEDFDTGTSSFITYMSVFKNAIDENSFRKVNVNSNENQNNVKNKDLFFTVSSETKEEVGMCATINTNNEDLYLNSFCFGYRLNDTNSVNNNYLCYLLLSKKYRKIISDLGQGFTRVNLSKKELLNVLVPIPSIEYQLLYSNTLKAMDTRIKLELDKLEKFNKLKKGLMQIMFV